MIVVINDAVNPLGAQFMKSQQSGEPRGKGSNLRAGRPSEFPRAAGSEEVSNSIVAPRKANPSKDGDAKPWVYVPRGTG
jgi:hypothetical protein